MIHGARGRALRVHYRWGRRFLPELIDLVWNRKINPGKVFDLTLPLDQVAEGYRAMDERRAIKTLLRPKGRTLGGTRLLWLRPAADRREMIALNTMRVGILGSGLMGGKFGTIFARAGHDVVFSYARRNEKLEQLARDAGPRARSGTPREAVENADAVLLAVHWSRLENVLPQAGDLSGKVVISCLLPMNANDTELVVAHTSSGAETLAKKVPGADVVAAFQTVPSEVLFDVFEARDGTTRPSLVYCGDSDEAKRVAATLIRDAGFDPEDAGPLRIARYTEPFALLIGQLAYEGEAGPEIAYRFERYGSS